MLAASQDIPIVCFAAGAQEHPYTFFSLKKNPVREPKDMVGKKVGIQATGVILLRALLAKNKIPEKDVTIVTIGADMAPLLTGQVDVRHRLAHQHHRLKVLGPDRVDMRLWDAGVKLYALPYYATANTLKTKGDVLEKYLRASGKGWAAYAHANRDKAVELLVKEFPNLVAADEREALDVMLKYPSRRRPRPRLGHDGPRRLAGPDRPLRRARPVLQAHPEAGGSHDARDPEGDGRRPAEDRLIRGLAAAEASRLRPAASAQAGAVALPQRHGALHHRPAHGDGAGERVVLCRARRVPQPARAVGLRQVHAAARRRRPGLARQRCGLRVRHVARRRRG